MANSLTSYERKYQRPYPQGYVDSDESKPVNAEALNNQIETFENVENYLSVDIVKDFVPASEYDEDQEQYFVEKQKWNALVEAEPEKNVIVGITMNGTEVFPDEDRIVHLTGGGGGGDVVSVNGKTGVVELGASDVGAIPISAMDGLVPTDRTIAGINLERSISKEAMQTALSDSNHRTVTDEQIEQWNQGSGDLPSNLVYSADSSESNHPDGMSKWLTDEAGNIIKPKTDAECVFMKDGSSLDTLHTSLVDQKMLGWNVPEDCPIQNEVQGDLFIQKVGRKKIDDCTFSVGSVGSCSSWSTELPNDKSYKTYSSDVPKYYLEGYVTVSNDSTATVETVTNRNGSLFIFDDRYLSSIKVKLKGKYIYYELAEPITMNIEGNEITERLDKKIDTLEKEIEDVKKVADKNSDSIEEIEKDVDTLNTSLVALAYDEESGSDNIYAPSLNTQSTKNGITITPLGNGRYNLNGTAAGDAFFKLSPDFTIKAGTYLIADGTTTNGTHFYDDDENISGGSAKKTDYGFSKTITYPADSIFDAYIRVANGTTLNNVVFTPMISRNLNATKAVPKMASVMQLNDSLGDYGLDNKISNWTIMSWDNSYLKSNDCIVTQGNVIKCVAPSGYANAVLLKIENANGDELSSVQINGETVVTVPSNAYKAYILDKNSSSWTVAESPIRLYLNNAIDEVKADLDAIKNITDTGVDAQSFTYDSLGISSLKYVGNKTFGSVSGYWIVLSIVRSVNADKKMNEGVLIAFDFVGNKSVMCSCNNGTFTNWKSIVS